MKASRIIAGLLLTLSLLIAPIIANAATPIGVPVSIGTVKTENATTTSLVFTTNVNINAGDFVFCMLTMGTGASTPTAVADSGGVNSWTRKSMSTSAPTIYYTFVANASAVASGGTITYTYNSTGGKKAMGCFSITGIVASPNDNTTTQTSNTATATSATTINSGVTGQGNELQVGIITTTNGTDFGTFTPPAGWTLAVSSTNANGAFRISTIVTPTTASIPWSPTWGTSVLFRSGAFASFKGAILDFGGPLLGVQ